MVAQLDFNSSGAVESSTVVALLNFNSGGTVEISTPVSPLKFQQRKQSWNVKSNVRVEISTEGEKLKFQLQQQIQWLNWSRQVKSATVIPNLNLNKWTWRPRSVFDKCYYILRYIFINCSWSVAGVHVSQIWFHWGVSPNVNTCRNSHKCNAG